MYSQSKEDQIIQEYFKDYKGRFLDIGASDGISFSNTRLLWELGWKGILLEPSKRLYQKLGTLYKEDPEVITINKALLGKNSKEIFYETESDLYTLGSFKLEHRELFQDYGPFIPVDIESISWEEFLKNYNFKYDFISIDTEGTDYEILQQMNLQELGTTMICVEWVYNKKEIEQYLLDNYYSILYTSAENIIGVNNVTR